MNNLTDAEREQIAQQKNQALQEAEQSFSTLDTDGNGTVSRNELMELAKNGMGLTQAANEETRAKVIDDLIAQFDTDGDGMISKNEWLTFFGQMYDAMIEQAFANHAAQQ